MERISDERPTVVLEVAAGHLPEVLCDIVAYLGDRRVALHGVHGVWRGRASKAEAHMGEDWLTVVIDGAAQDATWTDEQVGACIRELLDAGESPRDVARQVARRSGWPRRQVYRLAVAVHRED